MSEVLSLSLEGLTEATLDGLRAGTSVELTGQVLTLRDASARRLAESLRRREAIPVDLSGQFLYAVGPSPAKPGQVIGSAGPTTTERMAPYLPTLFAAGVRGIIGKGELHGKDAEAFVARRALYFAAVGGLGALLGKQIRASEVVGYDDLGTEALFRFQVVDFPVVVIIDREGQNFHEQARSAWRRTK